MFCFYDISFSLVDIQYFILETGNNNLICLQNHIYFIANIDICSRERQQFGR